MSDTPSAQRMYFEDFPVGLHQALGSRTVSEEEIVRFAREFDPQPFHIDRTAAAESMFGGIIASGWHTCSIAMRMLCDGFVLRSASLGSPGVDEIRWRLPVRPGDVLTLTSDVYDARPSASKPDRGVVFTNFEMRNQRGEVVLTMRAMFLLGRAQRPETATT